MRGAVHPLPNNTAAYLLLTVTTLTHGVTSVRGRCP